MKERRTDHRMLCAQLVELIYRDGAGNYRRQLVNLDDISQAGACVQVDTQLPDGSAVFIRCNDDELKGTVRYCGFREGSYFLGIEFSQDSRWSPDSFIPEHLFDPRSLSVRELVESAMRRVFD